MTVRALLRRPRALAFALVVAGLLALVVAPGAMANWITPESGGSPNADEIDSLYKIVLVIAAIVFFGVEGALVYCLVRYRAKKGRQASQIHGNTNLEFGWTIGAALILVILATVTFLKLDSIITPAQTGDTGLALAAPGGRALYASTSAPKPPDGRALHICVTGRQYIWRYDYAGKSGDCSNPFGKYPYSYETMVAPANTTVILDIQSTDVIHSWWAPALGGKFDAVPGYHNYTWFKAPHPAVYVGHCTELCGRNHADMNAHVKIVSPQEYTSYISQLKQNIADANKQAEKTRKQLQKQGQI